MCVIFFSLQVLDEESGEMSQLNPIPEEGGMESGQKEPEQVRQEEVEQVQSGTEPGQPAEEEEETRTAGVSDLPTPATTSPVMEQQTEAEPELMVEEGEGKGAEPPVSMEVVEVPEIQVGGEVGEEEEEEEVVREEEAEEEGKRSEMESSISEPAAEEVRDLHIVVCVCVYSRTSHNGHSEKMTQ